jgi:hypothetical protein
MASTYVDICNSALTRIGLPIISSFSDGTPQANACSNRWQADRDIVLRMHPWTCATVRVALAPSATAPAFDYKYAFPLPSDFLRALDISNDPRGSEVFFGARPRFEIESGSVLFDSSILYLRYVNQVANASQLDPECANAMALYIAYDLAQLLLNNEALVKQLNEEFEGAMATARNVNAQEEQTCMVIDTFERVRLWGPS